MSEFEPDKKPVLGCIADDVTGATDLAINLVNGGWRVVQLLGVPNSEEIRELAESFDAVVVALKARSIEPTNAQRESAKALKYLREIGAKRFYFKYCSTFDSTSEGNIGPVSEALMAELGCDVTVYCPAFPQAGRTVYQGHLFVCDQLLHESGMQHHPLNPMTDANLVRFLSQQVQDPVGLIPAPTVEAGSEAVRTQINALSRNGCKHLILDTVSEGHLRVLAEALTDHRLLTGGSGLGRFLPEAYQAAGIGQTNSEEVGMPDIPGRNLVLAGSCSAATNAQVAFMRERCPHFQIDAEALLRDEETVTSEILRWADKNQAAETLQIASTLSADDLADLKTRCNGADLSSAVEKCFGAVAKRLTEEHGFRRIVLAGGETSGAVVKELGIQALKIGREICTGVPWTSSSTRSGEIALALKSGNFGDERFMETALEMLP